LLPVVALTLTGCNNTIVSETTSEASQESEQTKDTGYSSYTLSFSFYYQGIKESAPSGSTIYYAGETNNWAFSPLSEANGDYEITLSALNYGTYSYKLLIEYDDKTVDWDSEKVVWPAPGGETNASFTVSETDGGSKNEICTLQSSLSEILGTESETEPNPNPSEDTSEGGNSGASSSENTSEGGNTEASSSEGSNPNESTGSGSSSGSGSGGDLGGSETFTYTIVLNNADALQAMEYDAALEEQQGVILDISLVTTSSTGEVTTQAATVDEVQFEWKGVLLYTLLI
ncbi:MAG: hypothetical protein LUD22_02465, partial [Coprobacillus sp.]|nr:hypothetical protein [Coprobacillus sp.]